uniref:Lipoprotein n=1 Tax=Thiomonas intermedia (strain K12) TaxID=75379 RepID=D5X4X5_THIK1
MRNKIVALLAVSFAISACPRPPSSTPDQAADMSIIGEQPPPQTAPPLAELSGLGMGGLIGYFAAAHFAAC